MIEGLDSIIKSYIEKLNSKIFGLPKTESKPNQKNKPQANTPIFCNSFGAKTNFNNFIRIQHNTKLGQTLASMIGMHEENGLAPTEITMGDRSWQWCAYTISHALKQSIDTKNLKNNDLGYFHQVSQYINWGKNHTTTDNNGKNVPRYNPISTRNVRESSMQDDRKARREQIIAQLSNNDPKTNMKEGDLIVWKSNYCVKANVDDKPVNKNLSSSHIGMIERITKDKNGNYYVWVIEGNANEAKSDSKYERYINKNDSEIGGQSAGEIAEVNKDDGIIRKCYTVDDLANFGYSGYINMNGIV